MCNPHRMSLKYDCSNPCLDPNEETGQAFQTSGPTGWSFGPHCRLLFARFSSHGHSEGQDTRSFFLVADTAAVNTSKMDMEVWRFPIHGGYPRVPQQWINMDGVAHGKSYD